MKKLQENPWKVCKTAKPYHVIVSNLSGSQTRESKEFNRFDDAKEYYYRMKARDDVFVDFGILNKKDYDVDIIHNFDGAYDMNSCKELNHLLKD